MALFANIHTRRLLFTLKEQSAAWVSQATGIPQSTLSFVRRGLRKLPGQYQGVLRNLYQRQSYQRLREAGAPTHQARRFSWFKPESVTLKTGRYGLAIKEMTLGRVATQLENLGLQTTEESITSLWESTEKGIKAAMRRTQMPLEYVEESYM